VTRSRTSLESGHDVTRCEAILDSWATSSSNALRVNTCMSTQTSERNKTIMQCLFDVITAIRPISDIASLASEAAISISRVPCPFCRLSVGNDREFCKNG